MPSTTLRLRHSRGVRVSNTTAEAADNEWVRLYHERLRQISVVDALDGIPPFPRLPGDLDDSVALDNWSAAWNAWISHEAVQLQRPLLKPMTDGVLAGIVQAERRVRQHLSNSMQRRELANAKDALNALEERLKVRDPAFESKRAVIVPILRPIFKRLPPGKWAAAFDEAYASAGVPQASDLSTSSPTTQPTLVIALRAIKHVAVELGSGIAPYAAAAWAIAQARDDVPLLLALGALVGLRIAFGILDSVAHALEWQLEGKAVSVRAWVQFLERNDFPTAREYPNDGLSNYLFRLENDGSMSVRVRQAAREMTTRLAMTADRSILGGMRARSAADAALDAHAPRTALRSPL